MFGEINNNDPKVIAASVLSDEEIGAIAAEISKETVYLIY